MQFCKNIKEISAKYDYFIFDLWGVIHDGSQAYDGVVEALSYLKSQGKKICFLSNAPRRSSKVAEVLNRFFIDKSFYEFILTSGEATFFDFKKNQENGFKDFGRKYFYIGPKKDIDLLDGLDYQQTADVSEASFAIATGFDDEKSVLQEKLPQIQEAKKHNLPLICVNPDLIVVKQNGLEMICAGVLADEYKKMGGEVIYYGKPFSSVYNMTYEFFGKPDKSKILAIGDGMETDIKGAHDFGIASALVTGGILCNKLGVRYGQEADPAKVKQICEFYKVFPQYIIPNL